MAVVGFDWGRADEVIFAPFEHSWVAQGGLEQESNGMTTLASIAVVPFEGDVDMGTRVAAVLQQETVLRVEYVVEQSGNAEAPAIRQIESNEFLREAMAQTVSHEANVDAVLFGRADGVSHHPSDWGWNGRESRRLSLFLVDRHGRLLWKDELPYTVVKGGKPPLENTVQVDLADRVMKHIEELHLDDLGYLPKKLLS